MIPVLYNAEDASLQSNGIGRLSDMISCLVSEERNSIYEVEFQYPVDGVHYADIQEGRIISVTHDEGKDRQPFRIYRRSAPIDGVVTFNAHHLAYDLQNVILEPFIAGSVTAALAGFKTHSITTNPFTFWTDKITSGTFKVEVPSTIWEKLGGSEGSILDIYGTGEWEFDGYTVKLHLHRGADNGVTIRYGKNLLDITQTIEEDRTYNAIIPYWHDEEGNSVYGNIVIGSGIPLNHAIWTQEDNYPITTENNEEIEFDYLNLKCVPYDFTLYFDNQPTAAELEAKAASFLAENTPWVPNNNLTVDFVSLWQTEEYENYANLQRVKLCDTVSVIYPKLGVSAKAQVIKTVWNALLDRYDEIELGDARTSYASTILEQANLTTGAMIAEQATITNEAIQQATQRITGGLGGHVLFRYDANNKPTEILIMDTEDESTAVHVLRINVNGIGFSSTGVNGTYSTAWDLSGNFVANFITTGTLSANLIKAGIIQGLSDSNYWDLISGELSAQTGYLGNFTLSGGKLSYDNGRYFTTISGFRIETGYYSTIPPYTPSFVRLEGNEIIFSRNNTEYPSYIKYASMFGNGTQGGLELVGCDPVGGHTWGYIYIIPIVNQTGAIHITSDVVYIASTGDNGTHIWLLDNNTIEVLSRNGFDIIGSLSASGTKSRIVETKDYSKRLLYCYETPSPMFGDIGDGEIGDDGRCYVWLDAIFSETIQTSSYQVFLQKYGNGECFVAERHEAFFIVEGTPGLSFGWELKAKQADYCNTRLEQKFDMPKVSNGDYAEIAQMHIKNIYKERGID